MDYKDDIYKGTSIVLMIIFEAGSRLPFMLRHDGKRCEQKPHQRNVNHKTTISPSPSSPSSPSSSSSSSSSSGRPQQITTNPPEPNQKNKTQTPPTHPYKCSPSRSCQTKLDSQNSHDSLFFFLGEKKSHLSVTKAKTYCVLLCVISTNWRHGSKAELRDGGPELRWTFGRDLGLTSRGTFASYTWLKKKSYTPRFLLLMWERLCTTWNMLQTMISTGKTPRWGWLNPPRPYEWSCTFIQISKR